MNNILNRVSISSISLENVPQIKKCPYNLDSNMCPVRKCPLFSNCSDLKEKINKCLKEENNKEEKKEGNNDFN